VSRLSKSFFFAFFEKIFLKKLLTLPLGDTIQSLLSVVVRPTRTTRFAKEACAMEQFFKIRAEKQNHIVDSAFSVFGRQGYRKASLSDIARKAGITKSMITYYFGSKKTLYLYLVGVSKSLLIEAIKDNISSKATDFFE
jgi:AcrR family transcriptional regulator